MFKPEDFDSENYGLCWPTILAVLVVQMVVLITLSIAVTDHSSVATASSTDVGKGLPEAWPFDQPRQHCETTRRYDRC
jgi:hypothetical protein